MILTESIEQIQSAPGFLCTVEKDIPYGKQLRLPTGTIVNIYDTARSPFKASLLNKCRKL